MIKAAAVFLAGLFAASAQAFTLSGTDPNLQGWQTKELTFYVNYTNCPSADVMNAAIDSAFALWNGVPTSSLKLVRGGDASTATPAQVLNGTATENPSIVCDTNFSATIGTSGSNIAGVGGNSTSNSVIVYGGLVLNMEAGANAIFSGMDATGQAFVVAHEVGHVIGFGHSGDTKALMYFDASAKEHLSLGQDDVDGMTYLYPRKELSGDKLLGCGSLAIIGAGSGRGGNGSGGPGFPTGALELGALALLAWLATRWSRVSRSSSWAA